MRMRSIIYSAMILVCGLFLAFGTITFFKGCPKSDKIMMCQIATKIVSCLGGIIIINSVGLILSKKKSIQSTVLLNSIMIFIFSILVPSYIVGGCKMVSMRCHTISFPMIYIVSIFGIIVSVVFLFVNRKYGEENK